MPTPRSVLVTGAFGAVGRAALRALLARGHRVRAFDLPTPANRRRAAGLPGLEACWGDVREPADLMRAVVGIDDVVHLAGVLPPRSERDPAGAEAVNVGGARALVAALEALRPGARLAIASSYSIYGETRHLEGLLTADTPVAPVSHYTRQKVQAEEIVRGSRLRWCVLRLGAVLSAETMLGGRIDPLIFDLPHDCRHEVVHNDDVAAAFARLLELDEPWWRVLLIGGGASCQLRYLYLINRSLGALGLDPLPPEAFSLEALQGGGWMDTSESQRLLGYQRWTFDALLADLTAKAGWRRALARALSPAIGWYLVRQSPYLARAG